MILKRNKKLIITISTTVILGLLILFYKNTIKPFYLPNQTQVYYCKIDKNSVEPFIRMGTKNNKKLPLLIQVLDEKGNELSPSLPPKKNGNVYSYIYLMPGETYKIVTKNPTKSLLYIQGLYINYE